MVAICDTSKTTASLEVMVIEVSRAFVVAAVMTMQGRANTNGRPRSGSVQSVLFINQ